MSNHTNRQAHSIAGTNALSRLLTASVVVTTLLTSAAVIAGEADVVDGKITPLGDNRFRIDATVLHSDTGWDHYANRWDVLAADGQLLGSRELAHPHENEQPFTRSLTLSLPEGTRMVVLQANDSVHGLGGKTFELHVPAP